MNKEEMKKRMDEFNLKMKELNAKIKDTTETVAIAGLEAKDKIGENIEDARSAVESAKEECRIASERGKGKISSELLKAQMNLDVAKEKIQQKKEAHDKEKLAKHIDDEMDYAEQCVTLSILAAKEAKLAYLEAINSKVEYDEKYKD